MSVASSNGQAWTRFSGDVVCPICGGCDEDPRGQGRRCSGGMSGDAVHCTREEHAGQAKFNARANAYLHFMKGECPCGVEHGPADPKPVKAKKVFGAVDCYYPYEDENATVLYRTVRTKEPKHFFQERSTPTGFKGGKGVMKGVRLVPFHLPRLLKADPAEIVFIVEGEKDVINLEAQGAVATCNAMGAGKWRDHYSDHLKGRNLALLPDNDDPGREHTQDVALSAHGKAASVKVVELPGLPEKGDVSDFLANGGTLDQIRELAAKAPEWTPPAQASAATIGLAIPWADVARPDDPFTIAELHREKYKHEGDSTLVFYRGEFWQWGGAAWRPKDLEEAKAEVAWSTHDHLMRLNSQALAEKDYKKSSVKTVGDVLMALKSRAMLEGRHEAPSWIDDNPPFPATDVLPTRNALVHLPTFVNGGLAIVDPTPRFFCPYALDYDFDQAAPPPAEWLRFLKTVWPNDPQTIDCLQDWFGYSLTPDTKQQKILAMIGPLRSGKGTIARVLGALVGSANVAGPTLSGIATNFGLSPLIGKVLAIISDARLSGRADQAVITERLLSISGEDSLTIDRKHQQAWTGKLPTRFVLISNELPRLNDASGALVGRMVILRFTESFYGREDKTLFNRLVPELPGILLWAIQGWQRLNARGYFVQPDSGQELVDRMNDLSSPVGQFAREKCEVGPGQEVVTGQLFDAWKAWCTENGRDHPGTAQSFGRDLTAALAGVRTSNPTTRDGKTVRLYLGVGLKAAF